MLGTVVAGQLSRHLVSEDAVVIGPERSPVLSVRCVERPARGGEIVLPGGIAGTWDVLTDDPASAARELDVRLVGAAAWNALRIAAGVPWIGEDLAPDTTLVQELGLVDSHVSMTKGCYIGQETVARVASRGRVQRNLRGLLLERPTATGAEIQRDGAAVGRLLASAVHAELGAIGLALIRREVEPGQAVRLGDVGGTVTTLPFGPG
ncbi:MAG: hypothetical protein HYX33_02245 [Actinobacteria bacterium]|nr:hypothetical protein [Actinomycetota bacterium]